MNKMSLFALSIAMMAIIAIVILSVRQQGTADKETDARRQVTTHNTHEAKLDDFAKEDTTIRGATAVTTDSGGLGDHEPDEKKEKIFLFCSQFETWVMRWRNEHPTIRFDVAVASFETEYMKNSSKISHAKPLWYSFLEAYPQETTEYFGRIALDKTRNLNQRLDAIRYLRHISSAENQTLLNLFRELLNDEDKEIRKSVASALLLYFVDSGKPPDLRSEVSGVYYQEAMSGSSYFGINGFGDIGDIGDIAFVKYLRDNAAIIAQQRGADSQNSIEATAQLSVDKIELLNAPHVSTLLKERILNAPDDDWRWAIDTAVKRRLVELAPVIREKMEKEKEALRVTDDELRDLASLDESWGSSRIAEIDSLLLSLHKLGGELSAIEKRRLLGLRYIGDPKEHIKSAGWVKGIE